MPRYRHTPAHYFNGGGRPDEPEEAVDAPTLNPKEIEASGPERPVPFGRKCTWLAVPAQEPDRVLAALDVRSSKVSG